MRELLKLCQGRSRQRTALCRAVEGRWLPVQARSSSQMDRMSRGGWAGDLKREVHHAWVVGGVTMAEQNCNGPYC